MQKGYIDYISELISIHITIVLSIVAISSLYPYIIALMSLQYRCHGDSVLNGRLYDDVSKIVYILIESSLCYSHNTQTVLYILL